MWYKIKSCIDEMYYESDVTSRNTETEQFWSKTYAYY